MKKMGVNIKLAKIDADAEEEVQVPFGIEGYPTVLLFLEGVNVMSIPYNYERRACNIIKWLKEWIKF